MTSILQALQQIEERCGAISRLPQSASAAKEPEPPGRNASDSSEQAGPSEATSVGETVGRPTADPQQAKVGPAWHARHLPQAATEEPAGSVSSELQAPTVSGRRGSGVLRRRSDLQQPQWSKPGNRIPRPVDTASLGHLRPVDCTHSPLLPAIPRAGEYRQVARSMINQLDADGGAVALLKLEASEPTNGLWLGWLAAGMAETCEKRLLLVDDRPHSHAAALLGCWSRRGLREVLDGTVVWRDAVRRTSYRNLWLIPAGQAEHGMGDAPPDPGLLVAQLRNHFDWVVWGSSFSDRQWFASAAWRFDAVYLVVPLGRATAGQVRRAAAAIRRWNVPLAGCLALEG